jgi:drug/metabolite transporter (DMT)-like permease
MKRPITLKIIAFLFLTDVLETFVQYCFKRSTFHANMLQMRTLNDAAVFISSLSASPFLWIGLGGVFCIFVIWVTLLSKIDLSVAVPVASFSYVGVPIVSAVFLKEQIPPLRWMGILAIVLGIILVSISTHRDGQNT